MKTKTINLYSFSELSEDAKQKAIENLWDINVDFSDWDNTIEDAKEIGLTIKKLSDHNQNKGDFISNAENCAKLILSSHGEHCNTYNSAKEFLDKYLPAKEIWDANEDNESFPFEYENEATELSEDFLHSLLEDYRIKRNKDYEYLTSEDAIIEAIEANEYTFTEDGKLENE